MVSETRSGLELALRGSTSFSSPKRAREGVFSAAAAQELDVAVAPMADTEEARVLDSRVRDLIHEDLDGLVGWMMNGGS